MTRIGDMVIVSMRMRALRSPHRLDRGRHAPKPPARAVMGRRDECSSASASDVKADVAEVCSSRSQPVVLNSGVALSLAAVAYLVAR